MVGVELGVTAATLSGRRQQFLAGGEAHLKARETEVADEQTQRLKSLVADSEHEQRAAARENPSSRGQPPFGLAEVEAMSRAASSSAGVR